MHRSLQLNEILAQIIGHLDKGSAYHAALTCHHFLEPALDIIWGTLTSFEQVVACLPDGLVEVEETQHYKVYRSYSSYLVNFARPLTPEDLNRYQKYAPRIRRFDIFGYTRGLNLPDWMPTLDALRALQVATGGEAGALTPNLREFVFPSLGYIVLHTHSGIAERLPRYLQLFFAGSVESVSISDNFLGYESCLPATLFALGSLTNLKRLHLYCLMEQPEFHAFLEKSSLRHLGHLEISNASQELIAHLASRPRLSSLHLIGPKLPLDSSERLRCFSTDSLDFKPFENIRNFGITTSSFVRVIGALNILPRASEVEELTIRLGVSSGVSEIEELFRAIRASLNLQTLTSLIWDEQGTKSMMHGPTVSLTPLFLFRNLKRLYLCARGSLRLTSEDIANMPTALPNIEELDIHGVSDSQRPLAFDHTQLLSLLSGCRSMTGLGLRFDTTGLQGSETISGGLFSLRELRVDAASPMTSPTIVLAFLKKIMPSGRLVEAGLERRRGDGDLDGLQEWRTIIKNWGRG